MVQRVSSPPLSSMLRFPRRSLERAGVRISLGRLEEILDEISDETSAFLGFELDVTLDVDGVAWRQLFLINKILSSGWEL